MSVQSSSIELVSSSEEWESVLRPSRLLSFLVGCREVIGATALISGLEEFVTGVDIPIIYKAGTLAVGAVWLYDRLANSQLGDEPAVQPAALVIEDHIETIDSSLV